MLRGSSRRRCSTGGLGGDDPADLCPATPYGVGAAITGARRQRRRSIRNARRTPECGHRREDVIVGAPTDGSGGSSSPRTRPDRCGAARLATAEAASIDGATPWRQFTSITFPLISAFLTINIVLSLKGFLQVFDQVVALTNGGPGTATESVTLLIFRGGFSGGEFAYQSANAVVFFIVITIVSLLQFRVLQRREADF